MDLGGICGDYKEYPMHKKYMSKTKPKVSIVVLNYNGRKHTVDCLDSLVKISYKDKEIILYNNGSVDDTGIVVKKRFPEVKLIERVDNIGFCRGSNDALQYCRGKYILFLNNDTIVTKDFLTPLVTQMEKNSKIGVVQPKILFYRSNKLQSGCAFFTNSGLLYYFGYDKNPTDPKYNVPLQLYSANGACMLVRKEVINKIKLFDEDYFSYVEETDFCHRALLSGYQIWYEPKAVIYHLGSMDNSKYKQSILLYNAFRNRITTYLKNLEAINLLKILPLIIAGYLFAAIIYFGFGKPKNSLAIFKALFYNIIHLERTLRKRKTIQGKYRQSKDKNFLPIVTRNPRINYYFSLFTDVGKYVD